ncbi:MAG TPA: TRAP transporter small permease [Casimicrobiaceae bacterium]|jgi:TRAP-type C4-dicarboxylate transport system permease small subunit
MVAKTTGLAADLPIEHSIAERIGAQRRALTPRWQRIDQAIVSATEIALFVIGTLFTIMITLEVLSRYVFGFSIFFVNAAAKLLLVWFFLMGAGLALRHGAHVGFELLLSAQTAQRRRVLLLVGYALSLVFFGEMIWAGAYSLGPALNQTEPGLDVSLVWAFLAIPVGFVLLGYHMLLLIAIEARRVPTSDTPR